MAFYSEDEINKLRENIKRGFVASPGRKKSWVSDFSLHDKLGLEHPVLLTPDELQELINKRSGTPTNDSTRIREIWTPYIDAELARVQTYSQTVEDLAAPEKRVFSILGGTSGTLKSTLRRKREQVTSGELKLANLGSHEYSLIGGMPKFSVHVDPDDAKLIIPEYQSHLAATFPGGANYVHQESRNIAEELRSQATKLLLPITYDTSGQFNNGYQTIQEMRDNGYRIDAIYCFADLLTVLERVQKRAKEEGREVPQNVIPTMQANLTYIIPKLWTSGMLDTLRIVDTNDPTMPKIILDLSRVAAPDAALFPADEPALKKYFGNSRFW